MIYRNEFKDFIEEEENVKVQVIREIRLADIDDRFSQNSPDIYYISLFVCLNSSNRKKFPKLHLLK